MIRVKTCIKHPTHELPTYLQYWKPAAAVSIGLLLAPMEAIATNRNDLPVLYGIELTQGAVRVWVVSQGCTKAEDFLLEVRQAGEYTELAVSRIREDPCRMAPHIVELSLHLPQNGDSVAGNNTRLNLLNPLSFTGRLLRRD